MVPCAELAVSAVAPAQMLDVVDFYTYDSLQVS
jgi:hypothetical protein